MVSTMWQTAVKKWSTLTHLGPIPTMSLTWLAANGCTSLVDHSKDPRWAKTVALRRIVALKWWLLSCAAVRPCQAVTNPQAMNPAMAQQYPWDRSQVMLTLWIVVGMGMAMYCARALSYLVLFLNSMKINEDQWSVLPWFQSFARIRNYPYMLQCLSPSDMYQPPMLACTVWLGKRSAIDDDWWTRDKRLQKCGVLPSMDTVRTVSFTGSI